MAKPKWNLNEYGEGLFKTLQSLIKYNGGNFKSAKQAKFLEKQRAEHCDNDILKFWKFEKKHLLKKGEYAITIDGDYLYGSGEAHGRGRGRVPFCFVYIMDKHGVKRLHHLKFQAHKFYDERYEVERVDGWSPVGNELKWERTEVTYFPPKESEKKKEEKRESKHVGEVGKRQQFNATVTFAKEIDTQYGTSLLLVMETPEGNVLKTFYSGSNSDIWDAEKGDKVTFAAAVKEHSEYQGRKETIITRITKFKVVEQA